MSALVLGSRGSRLARWQAEHVQALLAARGIPATIVTFTTEGDRRQDRPLPSGEGKGLFTKELEEALLDGRIDAAVHSLKDLPTDLPDGLAIVAVPGRADPREVLVTRDPACRTLGELPEGARLGSSSLRRVAQLRAVRRDLDYVPIRGNVPTRVTKVREGRGGLAAAVLAAAGLERLDLGTEIASHLHPLVVMPAPGQGAIAVEARRGGPTPEALRPIAHAATEVSVRAERTLLASLEGGCLAPIAAYTERRERGTLRLYGRVIALDGSVTLTASRAIDPETPETGGEAVARALLERGAEALIRDARLHAPAAQAFST